MIRKAKQKALAFEVARVIRNIAIGTSLILLASCWVFYKMIESSLDVSKDYFKKWNQRLIIELTLNFITLERSTRCPYMRAI